MIKIAGTFEIATRETGVNGDAKFHAGLPVKKADVPAFNEDLAWRELLEVAILVCGAREGAPDISKHTTHILGRLTKMGDEFFTDGMAKALGITDMRSGALAVRMDDPIDLWIAMDRYCRDTLHLRPALGFQPDEGVNFIRGAGNMFDALSGRAIQMGLDCAFAVKWGSKDARPQEAMQRALEAPEDAPALFVDAALPWVDEIAILGDQRAFTIYDEGCPPHCSYVAGHGAFSGVVYALCCLKYGLHNNRTAHEDVGQTLLSFAHCRSIAGVHYFQDNSEGFKLGVLAVKRGIEDVCKALGMKGVDVGDVAAACEHLDAEWAT